MISLILFLLSIILFGMLGGWIADQAKLPTIFGILVGAIFNVFGCLVLGCIWLVKWILEQNDAKAK